MGNGTFDPSGFLIDGQLRQGASTERRTILDPATEQAAGSVPHAIAADMDRAVTAAAAAFDSWSGVAAKERAEFMRAFADAVESRRDAIAQLVAAEMGTKVSHAAASTTNGAWLLRYYADLADSTIWEEPRQGLTGPAVVRREATGVAALIVPWNAPIGLMLQKLAPALASGCTVVAKPSPESPLDCYLVAEAAIEAGLPAGVVNIVPGDADAGRALVADPRVAAVSFTGSTVAGKAIMAACAARIARVGLELGGKSASIVLDDTMLEEAAAGSLRGACINNGEACVALSRILVPRGLYSEVVGLLADRADRMLIGDPRDDVTDLGPMVSDAHRARIRGYIDLARSEGARVATRTDPVDQPRGYYVRPVVLADVDNGMRVAQEEIFGPVTAVIPFDGVDDAVRIANDSSFGLSGAVWSRDLDLAFAVSRRVRTGTITVNGFRYDSGLPMGGFKESGLGRERGPEGLDIFLESKTINLPSGTTDRFLGPSTNGSDVAITRPES